MLQVNPTRLVFARGQVKIAGEGKTHGLPETAFVAAIRLG